jgi:broad specificity phosphatase PhoE
MYLNSLNKNVNITFIRNGTTKLNFEDRIHGNVNTELTEEGVNEINNIQLENLNYDIFYHSPLKSSKDTLLNILNKYNKNSEELNIKEDILITERKYGIFEELTKEEINEKYPQLYQEWQINDNINADGIESIDNLIDRIKLFISKVISYDYYNIMVITHTDFLYALFKYITNNNLEDKPESFNFTIDSCKLIYLKINIIYDKMVLILKIDEKEYKKMVDF